MGSHGSDTTGHGNGCTLTYGCVGDEQTFPMGSVSLRMLNELTSTCPYPSGMKGARHDWCHQNPRVEKRKRSRNGDHGVRRNVSLVPTIIFIRYHLVVSFSTPGWVMCLETLPHHVYIGSISIDRTDCNHPVSGYRMVTIVRG